LNPFAPSESGKKENFMVRRSSEGAKKMQNSPISTVTAPRKPIVFSMGHVGAPLKPWDIKKPSSDWIGAIERLSPEAPVPVFRVLNLKAPYADKIRLWTEDGFLIAVLQRSTSKDSGPGR